MRVLGLSDGMTGGAALIEDGRIIYAVHEERLVRQKMATGFPRQSIDRLLEDTGIEPGSLDAVAVATRNEFFREPAVAYDGWLLREQAPMKEFLLNAASRVNSVVGARPFLRQSYYQLKGVLGGARRKKFRDVLQRDFGFTDRITFVDHHLAHACSAYFTSGFRDALVVTMDGAGDNLSSRVYSVRDGVFRELWKVTSFDSIGNYYAYVTHLCGFKAQRHEGKITGLAAYGKPAYSEILRQFIDYDDGTIVNRGGVFYWAAVDALRKALPSPFDLQDLASSAQEVLEDVSGAYVRRWAEETGHRNVAVAGGVFANVKLNQRIHELEAVDSVFVHPGMGDEGLPVGAAFALHSSSEDAAESSATSYPVRDVYFGPEFSDEDIGREIQRVGLRGERVSDVERRTAELLADGHVVARFDGRMEYGPRALGNRSILYQPTDPSVNEWLNKRLKRTEFMPFAPVTLEEYADECFVGMDGARHTAEFMTITFDCTPWMRQHCPAVVHVDGTARPQVIRESVNPRYYRIVEEYRQLTGLPVLINTSFNMHEEPIVCTPGDAIRGFVDSGLEYLSAGNWIVTRGGEG